jgi:hypothetical protein
VYCAARPTAGVHHTRLETFSLIVSLFIDVLDLSWHNDTPERCFSFGHGIQPVMTCCMINDLPFRESDQFFEGSLVQNVITLELASSPATDL